MTDTLTGSIHRPADLSTAQRARMADLLHQFFENVTPAQFNADLDEKEWVFVFQDGAGTIWGFSTLARMDLTVDDRPITAVFSGDTIIHPDYWHELELPKIWGAHVFALADEVHAEKPEAKVYWFLISSGYKTYRFLPVFFNDFFPTYRQPMPPAIQRTLDALAAHRFGDQYDPATGIVRFHEASPLRPGVAEVDASRLRNKDIAFFVAKNPGYVDADQLACLVEIDRTNITAAGRRMLGI